MNTEPIPAQTVALSTTAALPHFPYRDTPFVLSLTVSLAAHPVLQPQHSAEWLTALTVQLQKAAGAALEQLAEQVAAQLVKDAEGSGGNRDTSASPESVTSDSVS